MFGVRSLSSFLGCILTFCRLCCCSIDSIGSDQDGVPSKVSDSGVGGLESGEDSWISDTEVRRGKTHVA